MRLAVFDIDGTLVAGPSTEKRFFLRLLRAGRLGPRQIGAFLWFFARWLPRFRSGVARKNKAYLYKLPVPAVRKLADAWVPRGLREAWFQPCVARLREHLAEGDRVVLLSGTPDFVAEAIARELGVSEVIASRCVAQAGRFGAAPPQLHPFGAVKADLVRDLARRAGLPLDAVVAYGDSFHDLALLECVGRAVAVRPDKRLLERAGQAGWEILGERRARGSALIRLFHTS